jgi:hypothetical protein
LTNINKHTSLLRYGINNGSKNIYSTGHFID